MARSKLGCHLLSDDELRTVTNLLSNPVAAQAFAQLLNRVQQALAKEQGVIIDAYLLDDAPVARAMALKNKGKAEFVAELLGLINSLTK